tara:strand:+ start:521 stop:793 length:273 start_codon:yes stop_codon:yes gene_type:complete
MAVFFTPLGTQESAPTTSGAATTVGNAQVVYVVNTSSTAYLVTLEEADGTDIGSFTVPRDEFLFIHKGKFDKMFAANAAIKFTKASYPRG